MKSFFEEQKFTNNLLPSTNSPFLNEQTEDIAPANYTDHRKPVQGFCADCKKMSYRIEIK